MPILSRSSRRAVSQRVAVAATYSLLTALGITMVVPFLITLTLSISSVYDYQRFSIVPKYLYSDQDRFVKYLADYFNIYSGWQGQLAANIPNIPTQWTNWQDIGRDAEHADALASAYLQATPSQWAYAQVQASDYADFCESYSLDDSVAAIDPAAADGFLSEQFEHRWMENNPAIATSASAARRDLGAISLLRSSWNIPFTDFDQINFNLEMQAPLWQESWFPSQDPKNESFVELKRASRDLLFMPGIHDKWIRFLQYNGITSDHSLAPVAPENEHKLWLKFIEKTAPASPTIPYASRVNWRNYLQSDATRELLHLKATTLFDIAYYNSLAGTHYESWFETPFPLPASAPPILQQLWQTYGESYPIRLTTLEVRPELTAQFQAFLQNRFKTIGLADQFLHTSSVQWTDFTLSPTPPEGATQRAFRNVWSDFVKGLPVAVRQFHSSESAFQEFELARYGNLDAINRAWGTHYAMIEEVFPPFASAYAITFRENRETLVLNSLTHNYKIVCYHLFKHANAVPVTLLLIIFSIISSLTINPMAAYALSRFNMKGQDKIILFLLATSAFPAMISAIPGFLLMRDLGMLNTFFALILPGAANGMAIFILKGFFDSLPPELVEAAVIDGAREWQIFLHVIMPMVKPILAVNALNAFIAAYEGWQWALIVCQNPKMWTLAVWMYQESLQWAATPWITSAGYVVISIPTLIVFLSCQRIILRGIVIPQMK